MTRSSESFIYLLFATTLLTSAVLLFWVQPLLAKLLLPYLGGSPSVWNTCMMFFQGMLLAGYLYAHISARYLSISWQFILQLTLLIIGALMLPFIVNPDWFMVLSHPRLQLLGALLTLIAIPQLTISATAPLLQRWFTRTTHKHAQDPYFLYASSNLGSVLALLLFPFVLEPHLTLTEQSELWRLVYFGLIALTCVCAFAQSSRGTVKTQKESALFTQDITHKDRLMWLALAFAPSSLLLGVTTYITTDIASVPLLWIVPLLLYLLTFIIAFMRTKLIKPSISQLIQVFLIIPFMIVLIKPTAFSYYWITLLIHLVFFFFTALVCHQTLVAKRPHHNYLTEFYLWLSLGGFLGGVFNAIIAPMVFSQIFEYPLVVLFALLLRPPQFIEKKITWVALSMMVVLYGYFVIPKQQSTILITRNFFGTTFIKKPYKKVHYLISNTTIHGLQVRTPEQQTLVLSYYYPLVALFNELQTNKPNLHVALAGLGAGITACLSRAQDEFTFYEINPAIVKIANNPNYFSYLKLCPPKGGIKLGDARLQLQHTADHQYDVIVLDTFSSDSIPVHMITREAINIYRKKLTSNGVILVHISNRHLNLVPVLAGIAENLHIHGWYQQFPGFAKMFISESQWIVLSDSKFPFGPDDKMQNWTPLHQIKDKILWTDDYSNIVRVFKW